MTLKQADQWSLCLLNVDQLKRHIKARNPEIQPGEVEREIRFLAACVDLFCKDTDFANLMLTASKAYHNHKEKEAHMTFQDRKRGEPNDE